MKRISVCFLVCLCLFSLNLGFAEDTRDQVSSDVPDLTLDVPPAPAEAEATAGVTGEGEITYSATVEPVESPSDEDVSVVEAKICEGINEREPIAPGDVFPSDINELYCFSRVKASDSTEIKHIWYCNGEPVAEVPLNIGVSTGWRTFSSKIISAADKGNWKVEIVSASGTPMKTIQFIVN